MAKVAYTGLIYERQRDERALESPVVGFAFPFPTTEILLASDDGGGEGATPLGSAFPLTMNMTSDNSKSIWVSYFSSRKYGSWTR